MVAATTSLPKTEAGPVMTADFDQEHVASLFREFYPQEQPLVRGVNPPRRPLQVQVQTPATQHACSTRYIAARPINRHGGFSGSGFPHPDVHSAFHNTPNIGTCESGDVITLDWPAAYYEACATIKHPPCVHFWQPGANQFATFELPEGSPFRDLDYGPTTLLLRATPLPRVAKTPEHRLYEAGYPCVPAPGPFTVRLEL